MFISTKQLQHMCHLAASGTAAYLDLGKVQRVFITKL
jgi:hypothetical protein